MSDDKEIKIKFEEDAEQSQAENSDEDAAESAAQESPTEEVEDAGTAEEVEAEPEPELTAEEKHAAQVAELEDRLLRNAADFENYKKRAARRFEEIVRGANDQIVLQLLEVVDNFDRALGQSNEKADLETHRQGMRLIYEQLTGLLSKRGVTPIEAVGKPFDPNLHEAVMQIESDEHPEGTVAMEISKGYRQGERVLRHAKVGVSKGSGPPKEESDKKEAGNDE